MDGLKRSFTRAWVRGSYVSAEYWFRKQVHILAEQSLVLFVLICVSVLVVLEQFYRFNNLSTVDSHDYATYAALKTSV